MFIMPVVKLEKNKDTQKKSGLLIGNPVYKPFRYPWCYDAWLTQQRIHWLPDFFKIRYTSCIQAFVKS